MNCRKCKDTGEHHHLPCVHCKEFNNANDLRKAVYGADNWRKVSMMLFFGSTGKPLAELVLARAGEVKSLNPAKRAVLAQDIRRCLRSLFTLGGTPQARVAQKLHTIAFDAAETTQTGTFWKPDPSTGRVYFSEVRYCAANERWTYDEAIAGRKADQQAAIQATENASAGVAVVNAPLRLSLLLSVSPPQGAGESVNLVVDVEIDAEMVSGNEFRLADHCYHFPSGVRSLVSPMLVDGHGPCGLCNSVTNSQPYKQFKLAFAQARVKAEESETHRIIRELKELHAQITGDMGV
jgi:hypothetical protein